MVKSGWVEMALMISRSIHFLKASTGREFVNVRTVLLQYTTSMLYIAIVFVGAVCIGTLWRPS